MKKKLIILMALILGIMVAGCNKAETSEQSEGISQEIGRASCRERVSSPV